MDHKEQHHLHHQKEREEKKREEKEFERQQELKGWPIHPAWFVVLGIILTVLAIIVWTLFLQ